MNHRNSHEKSWGLCCNGHCGYKLMPISDPVGTLITRRLAHMTKSMKLLPLMPTEKLERRCWWAELYRILNWATSWKMWKWGKLQFYLLFVLFCWNPICKLSYALQLWLYFVITSLSSIKRLAQHGESGSLIELHLVSTSVL